MSQYYPLKWHEEKLTVLQASFAWAQQHLAEMETALKADRADIAWLDFQIAEAKRAGLSGFDATAYHPGLAKEPAS